MSAEASLQTLLAAAAAVTALAAGRIAQDRAEQGWPAPFVIYSRTDTDKQTTLDGAVIAAKVTLDLQCWADTREAADALADACEAAIDGGADGSVTGRATAYDSDLDLEATTLVVEWWE